MLCEYCSDFISSFPRVSRPASTFTVLLGNNLRDPFEFNNPDISTAPICDLCCYLEDVLCNPTEPRQPWEGSPDIFRSFTGTWDCSFAPKPSGQNEMDGVVGFTLSQGINAWSFEVFTDTGKIRIHNSF